MGICEYAMNTMDYYDIDIWCKKSMYSLLMLDPHNHMMNIEDIIKM